MLLDSWAPLATGLARYVREFLPGSRRGALPIRLPGGNGQIVGVFGNDGYAADGRVKQEVAALRQRLREAALEELGFGLSEDGGVVAEVSSRIERHLSGRGGSYPLDGRYERRGGGPGWTLIREIGAQARLGVVADGIRAYLAVRERPDGRWAYVVGRMSPFAPFAVPSILRSLNEAEGPGEDGWGGSNLVGGSPRVHGSKLPPEEVERIINGLLQASRATHGPAGIKGPRGAGRPRAATCGVLVT